MGVPEHVYEFTKYDFLQVAVPDGLILKRSPQVLREWSHHSYCVRPHPLLVLKLLDLKSLMRAPAGPQLYSCEQPLPYDCYEQR